MFDKPKTLNEHLMNDDVFTNQNDTLIIIDNYYTKGLKHEAVNFYRNAFRSTGIKNIVIYFQVKRLWPKRINEIRQMLGDEDFDIKLSYMSFVLDNISFISLPSLKEELYGRENKVFDETIDFMTEMEKIDINVTLQPYNSLNIKPPFHGRYWLTKNIGYIVDASLGTYGTGKIFAQLMDNENYEIISNLFECSIVPNSKDFGRLSKLELLKYYRNL